MGAHSARHLGRRRQAVHEGRSVQGTNWSVVLRTTYEKTRPDVHNVQFGYLVYNARSCVSFVRGMNWLGSMNTLYHFYWLR